MQALTGETDVSAEPNVKSAINATEHAHSTPQPEKVPTLHKHVCKGLIFIHFLYTLILLLHMKTVEEDKEMVHVFYLRSHCHPIYGWAFGNRKLLII